MTRSAIRRRHMETLLAAARRLSAHGLASEGIRYMDAYDQVRAGIDYDRRIVEMARVVLKDKTLTNPTQENS